MTSYTYGKLLEKLSEEHYLDFVTPPFYLHKRVIPRILPRHTEINKLDKFEELVINIVYKIIERDYGHIIDKAGACYNYGLAITKRDVSIGFKLGHLSDSYNVRSPKLFVSCETAKGKFVFCSNFLNLIETESGVVKIEKDKDNLHAITVLGVYHSNRSGRKKEFEYNIFKNDIADWVEKDNINAKLKYSKLR